MPNIHQVLLSIGGGKSQKQLRDLGQHPYPAPSQGRLQGGYPQGTELVLGGPLQVSAGGFSLSHRFTSEELLAVCRFHGHHGTMSLFIWTMNSLDVALSSGGCVADGCVASGRVAEPLVFALTMRMTSSLVVQTFD